MVIENLTPQELDALRSAIKKELSYHEDNSYRYKKLGGYDHYPGQGELDRLRSLSKKLN